MRRNRDFLERQDGRAALIEQLRANAAFEHLVVSILWGSVFGGGVYLGVSAAGSIASGYPVIAALMSAAFGALALSLITFFVGFAAGAVLITPLHRALEKARRRNGWPYFAAAVAIAAFGIIAASMFRGGSLPELATIIAILSSASVMALIFARLMAPVWRRAAEESEDDPPSVSGLLH